MACDDPPPPVWIPDWSDPAAYSEFRSRGDLAWQFLRRNAEFQADWKWYASVPEFWPDGGGKTPKITGRSFDLAAPMIYYYANPPGQPDETLEEYEARMGECSYFVTNLEDGLCRKWGVKWINSPALPCFRLEPYDDPFPVVDSWRDVLFVDRAQCGESQCRVVEEGYLLDPFSPPERALASIFPMDVRTIDQPGSLVPIWFSLDRSLKDQLNEALFQLMTLRDEAEKLEMDPLGQVAREDKKRGRRRVDYRSSPSVGTLITALRVYDASLCRVRHADIQSALNRERFGQLNRHGTIRDTARDLRLAKQMVEFGYRTLIGLN